MTLDEIKEKIKDWVNDIGPMKLTIGDLQMFAFEEAVSGKDVEKGVFSLANEGFLVYCKNKIKNPIGQPIPTFRKNN